MKPEAIIRKVRQHDDDILSIYEMLADISATQSHHSAKFEVIDGRLDGIDGRLDGIDGRLDGIDGRLDGIDGRLDGIDGRLTEMNGTLGSIVDLLRHR